MKFFFIVLLSFFISRAYGQISIDSITIQFDKANYNCFEEYASQQGSSSYPTKGVGIPPPINIVVKSISTFGDSLVCKCSPGTLTLKIDTLKNLISQFYFEDETTEGSSYRHIILKIPQITLPKNSTGISGLFAAYELSTDFTERNPLQYSSSRCSYTPIGTGSHLKILGALPLEVKRLELPLQELRGSPNPTSTMLTLHASEISPGSPITILDITGRVFNPRIIQSDEDIQVDVSLLPNGVYSLQVENKTMKFIVQH